MRCWRSIRRLAVRSTWTAAGSTSGKAPPSFGWKRWSARWHRARGGWAGCGAGADDIGYVNAHGTGTPLNDVAESRAYAAAFAGRRRPVPVSSTKGHFGHCLGAAGALEAAVTVIAIRSGALFPTLRLGNAVECAEVDWLKGEPRRQSLPTAMSVSAGFGGSNAALVLGAYEA